MSCYFYSARTVKDRVQTLIRFHNLLYAHMDELADLVVMEHGKNKTEVSTRSLVRFMQTSRLTICITSGYRQRRKRS
jgi:acyl-CoA reductase-like NAD-dependent aldehyde dehydrogenase